MPSNTTTLLAADSADPQLTANMEAEIEAKLQISEGLVDDGYDDEGCEAELMALVVVDEFPIEVRLLYMTTLSQSLPD